MPIENTSNNRISVVIPTLNAGSEICSLIRKIKGQTVVPDEIIVVDSSSRDDTVRIAQEEGAVIKVIRQEDFDHGGTRHDAFLMTKGDFVLFLTQDAVPASNDYIENLLMPFSDPMVALVSGRQLPKTDARRFEQLVRAFNYPDTSNVRTRDDFGRYGIKTFFASDVCSAYRKSAYIACGGFERPCNTNEDMAIAAAFIRAGYKVAYAADACVYHSHNMTPRQQYDRNKQVGIFLQRHEQLFEGVSETSEGARLVKKVSVQLIHERQFGELFAFGVDCVARLLGNRAGRRTVRNGAGQ